MKETLESATRRLASARQRGEPDDLAEALALHANALVPIGQATLAQSELDEAAAIHQTRGRAYDQGRCTQLAATLCRFQGKLAEAKQRAAHALELAGAQGTLAVSAYAELGEIALAGKDPTAAAEAWRLALAAGELTGLIRPARAALLRKRAAALVTAGQFPDAVRDLESAYDLLVAEKDSLTATRTLIEKATAYQHAAQFADAERTVQDAWLIAQPAGDHAALADLHLLRATQSLHRREAGAALASAESARAEALAARAPTPYVGAALTIAQLSEANGDRLAAYAALATGWATLGDLLGRDLARAAFEPKLKELRARWGAPDFAAVRSAYEAERQRA